VVFLVQAIKKIKNVNVLIFLIAFCLTKVYNIKSNKNFIIKGVIVWKKKKKAIL